MAATFLPPIVPSPFGKAFDRKPYVFIDTGNNSSTSVYGYHYDYHASPSPKLRAVSVPASPSPLGKLTDSNENARCGFLCKEPSISPTRRASSVNAAGHSPRHTVKASLRPAEVAPGQTETFPIYEDTLVSTERGVQDLQYYVDADRSSDQSWNCALNDSTVPTCDASDVSRNHNGEPLLHLKQGRQEVKPASLNMRSNTVGKTAENFRRWASTFRHKRGSSRHKIRQQIMHTDLEADKSPDVPLSPPKHSCHQKRTSNASSRFVATVKTASMSNDSMSLLPRSHRFSRVTDARGNRGSDPRSSIDSQKTPSVSSSDESALRRSIKRRQVLQEVLSSEEGYVGDLKALHNLFSTLLPSIPAISTQTRNSIQRNVTEMLHLHEQIVDELHRVALRATVREWKQAASPLGPSRRRHRKWQSLDATSFHTSVPRPNHSEMYADATNVRSHGISAYAADPAEVSDVVRVFANKMGRFFVYEEYCAKYETMFQELGNSHKTVPQWPSYEAGMEALANSIASLNQRRIDGRKGLTAADLLIKPIQRICRYPLLFSDLQKHTPVIDCPKSSAEVEGALSKFREMVREVNLATDDAKVQERIQRRWLLQDRLRLCPDIMTTTQFRMLGHVLLCGVLHVAYQTHNRVEGGYMLCMLFKDYLLLAVPRPGHPDFEIVVTMYLSDAKVVSAEDGRGKL
jgi:RhoGEF domain